MDKTILIVEDEKEMRKLEADVLKKEGFEIFEADTAEGAINLLKRVAPDLVVLDIKLPTKERGITVAKELRKKEETKNAPIIFATAYEGVEEAAETNSISNCTFLKKPFSIKVFLKEVKRCLEDENARDIYETGAF